MKTLERRLGLGAVVAISISAMLGSGIFVLPGLAAAKTGPLVWLAYLRSHVRAQAFTSLTHLRRSQLSRLAAPPLVL